MDSCFNYLALSTENGGVINFVAHAGSDLFDWPGIRSIDDIPIWGEPLPACFTLTARIQITGSRFADAGGLVIRDGTRWAKHCVERNRHGQLTIVTVVNHCSSDDCGGADLKDQPVWMRLSRSESRLLMMYSTDGVNWRFARTCHLDLPETALVGFFAQAPFSTGCEVIADCLEVSFTALPDTR